MQFKLEAHVHCDRSFVIIDFDILSNAMRRDLSTAEILFFIMLACRSRHDGTLRDLLERKRGVLQRLQQR